jgi:arylsulfatase A-like enzyme
MNRREFLKTGTAAAVATATKRQAKAKAKTRRPNVLYVFSDQHRASSLPGEPFNQAVAPNIEAFREQNCSMERCVSNYPLCSPHRAILMSGLYSQQNGVLRNVDTLDPNVCRPLGETFRSAGYHTGYVGKWHIHGQESINRADEDFIPKGPYRMGFEDWHVWADTDDHYHGWTFNPDTGEKIQPEGWGPVNMTDQAIDFLKAQPKDEPWFLVLSWNPPHPPFDPPADDQAPYPADQIKFRPNVRVQPDASDPHKGVRSDTALRKSAQGYMGGITGVDKEFARVLQALQETGQAEDTIVVYTSDHGEMMGSQGLMGKRVPYEESCRVPFIIRYPGVTPNRHKSGILFSSVDIYPTLCGIAGIPVPQHCAGRDLSDVMRGHRIEEPEHVFMLSQNQGRAARANAENAGTGKDGARAAGGGESGCPNYRGVRTKTHTYVVADTGRWLLYDNISDPYQMKNLVGDSDQQLLMEALDAKIEAWLYSVKDTFPYAAAKNERYVNS